MSGTALTQHTQPPVTARWLMCFVIVLASHVGIALLLLRRVDLPLQPPEPPAVMLELTQRPEPVAEPAPPDPASPTPLPFEPPTPDVPPVVLPAPEPPPPQTLDLPRARTAPLPAHPRPRPRPVVVQPTSPEPRPPVQTIPAPTPAVSSQAVAAATTSWQIRLQAHLARFKRHPPEAQMRHQEGTPMLRFTMARDGRVLSFGLANGSGHELLDQEALGLMERAQPLPPLPPEVSQGTIQLVVPLRFQLR
jgi:protein TonB